MHVSIGKVRRGADGKRYYTNLGREGYYLKGGDGEPPGVWAGRLCADFGLRGEVQRDHFCSLFDGQTPSGEPLSKNWRRKDRRPAFDATHSLIKDGSTIASVNRDWQKRIAEEVMTPSVAVSLDFLERHACYSRRGRDGTESVRGRGFAVATFDHMAARPVDGVIDPDAHRHCVIFNADGEGRTLDGEYLFDYAQAAAALASVEESYRYQQMGFATKRDGRSFRIVGVPKALVDENSGRSKQIREHAGPDASPQKRDRSNGATRELKPEDIDHDALWADWHERNERHGLTEERVRQLASHKPTVVDEAKELDEATAIAVEQSCRHESTFTFRKFVELVAIESQCRGVSADAVMRHAWSELEQARRGVSETLVYRGVDRDGEERWTTRELFELERRILETADRTRHERSFVRDHQADAAIREKGTLTPEQEECVRSLLTNPGKIQCLIGGAGTGKTFTLDGVRIGAEAAGYRCLGTAVASRAARGLGSEANMEAMNTTKLLYEIDAGRLSLNGACVFLDEAAMCDTRQMARLIAEIEKAKNARLICTGDHRQLQSIGAGGVFKSLCDRLGDGERPGYVELSEIIRQKTPEQRRTVEAFRDGRVTEAVTSLVERRRLKIGFEVEDTQERLVKRWGKDETSLEEKLILASTNKQVDSLNERCQELRLSRGELGGASIAIKSGEAYAGDRILFRKNAAKLGISNGDMATVLGVSRERAEIRVRLDHEGREVRVPLGKYDHEDISLGYAATGHKAQGSSVWNCYLFVHGRMTDAQMSYVMASRHKNDCVLYTTRDDAGDGLTKLVSDMGRDRMKSMAHEIGDRPIESRSRKRRR